MGILSKEDEIKILKKELAKFSSEALKEIEAGKLNAARAQRQYKEKEKEIERLERELEKAPPPPKTLF